ncbi:alpha/beta hydrolase [Nocardia vinacea]|uniref:Alpha/beta hydrolase n=1 Tax=Nocardia vinacea TaxID=96468 RepID=A0ABZ1YUJ4_9NOCA|nr:alpha/beta hydrolase [Nocardia vinacea]
MTSILERVTAFDRDHQTKTLTTGGYEWTYYTSDNDGATVLLLTGGAGIAIGWLDLTPALHPNFHTLAVDYPPGPTTLDELADGIIAILDAENIDSAHMVGQSAGGMLAEVLSQRAPERVRSLTLSGTGLYGPEDIPRLEAVLARTRDTPWEQTLDAIRTSLRSTWGESAEAEFWIDRVDAATRTGGQQGAINSYLRLLDAAQRLPQLQSEPAWQGPTLIIKADDDPLITTAHTQRLRHRHPTAESRTFTDGGHSLLISRPSDYIATVTEFLQRQTID